MIHVSIYRYHPDRDLHPRMDRFDVAEEFRGRMVLDLLEHLHEKDPSLVYRRSCREGVCGSDGMNINGKNRLACITPTDEVLRGQRALTIRPLPGMPVIRDLVVDQTLFFEQYAKVRPWLINQEEPTSRERPQTPEQRARLDGLYECILCGCCTSQCPSWWWNPEDYLGPAALLQAYRFIADSRDKGTDLRLSSMKDPFSLFRCRSIGNCTWVCPKGLNPMRAIGHIRREMLKKATRDV
ncbi:MAG: succinate dehydrogenase iron-sulfur subunit [Alcanivorax sp.]|jgi:succinate dehydrogenase / fumarate reductase iron-sulfur subunit|nr:succinate dehydrogenase iron-sulfur subunit [Alcanivorax sp.]MAY10872.1 succinate dehydrogenase iron-sulfur subunit [Alcanivorax sp.]MBU59255.1 succinate dehydrogenase iron-sulfur subunit [Alcanivorax sp.]QJX02917.1 succinate dehydrogenase iron-sulfur subunit [Alcanivorax sp. IO_7]